MAVPEWAREGNVSARTDLLRATKRPAAEHLRRTGQNVHSLYMAGSTRKMTVTRARREWASVLRSAERGGAVEVTRNGQAVAAVVSMERYRRIEGSSRDNLSDVIARFRAALDARDAVGPDPWGDVRDRSPGRDVDLD